MQRTRLVPPMVQILTAVCLLPATALAGPGAAASAAWRNYVTAAEARIDRELRDNGSFLGLDIRDPARARDIRRKLEAGAVYIQKIQENGSDDGPHVEDGLIHHWLGAIFIPGTGLDKVLSWIQDYDAHQRHFTDVERSRLIRRNGDTFEVYLRFVRKKIVSVRYDTYHTVVYRREDATPASSRSTATRIDEAGQEPGKDSGFLWAMNSYWRFIEEDNAG